ncbi:MAG: fumarylacetoacetate hydrolase family protein [Actinomycetia bacterium]|nr:fumarylacetoacetate hydrolase family protein [Actinomycetes bacterium]
MPLPTAEGFAQDPRSAYDFAREYARDLPGAGDRYGFKFGCGEASLCPFQEQNPLFGTLWKSMLKEPGAQIDRRDFTRGFVEGELAFRFAQDVDSPLRNVKAVRQVATEVAPAVELPDFPFGDRPLSETPNLDVAALNGIARSLVVGEFRPTKNLDVDDISMTGSRNGAEVISGDAKDVTAGSHWRALQLAVELILEQGYTIGATDVVITGTMGDPTSLEQGAYIVDFKPKLGSVRFSVT